MTNSKFIQITKDQHGREAIMVRVDKTIKEMMQEKPSGRWDADYWHPNFQDLMSKISDFCELKTIGDFVLFITYGQVGQRIYDERGDVDYIQTINIQSTGIDYEIKKAKIKAGSHNDPARSRLKYGDLLMGNSGMGGLGKAVIFSDKKQKVNISQDIDILRFKNINPYYVVTFLKTKFGNEQIWIRSKGVGAPKISFDEIKAIKIPVLPDSIQNHIESEYKKMSAYHDKAMEGKEKSDESAYKKNIEIAEKMLKDLIARTEAVIRGERDDVI